MNAAAAAGMCSTGAEAIGSAKGRIGAGATGGAKGRIGAEATGGAKGGGRKKA